VPEDYLGVFYGFAKLNGDSPEKMVMSIGFNPQFENKEKTVVCLIVVFCLRMLLNPEEVYIVKSYPEPFYDAYVQTYVVGFVREMTKFDSLGTVIVLSSLYN
jgi:riboflavin kinase